MSRRLILVRHSLPDIRREVPAADWRLSPDGVARARRFARQLGVPRAATIFASREPKAMETAHAMAGEWGVAVQEEAGLHEHERPEARMLSREAFEQKVRDLYARPDALVFGAETAAAARRRFTVAVMRLVTRVPDDVVVVSHGTVMTLFVAEVSGVEPFAFWKRQEMPFAATLSLPDLRLEGTTFIRE